jgi:hypothetical protein
VGPQEEGIEEGEEVEILERAEEAGRAGRFCGSLVEIPFC